MVVVVGADYGGVPPSGSARVATEDVDPDAGGPVAATLDHDAWWVDAGAAAQREREAAGKLDRRDWVTIAATESGFSRSGTRGVGPRRHPSQPSRYASNEMSIPRSPPIR